MTALQDAVGVAFAGAPQPPRSGTGLTLSAVGGCPKRAAFLFHDWTPTDTPTGDEKRAANLGTAIHAWFLPVLANVLNPGEPMEGVDYEIPVHLTIAGREIPGRIDLISEGIVDLKTVGDYSWYRVLRDGPPLGHIGQLISYGDAFVESNYTEIGWYPPLELLYMHRATGQTAVFEVDPDPYRGFLDGWWAQVTAGPAVAERGERGPGLSVVCDGCEFLKACWGPDAVAGELGPQHSIVMDGETVVVDQVAKAAALYDDAAAREKSAKADKEFARAILDSTPSGEYGGWRVGFGPDKTSTALDPDAATALIERLGMPVPTKPAVRKGAIQVRKVPA